jgi:predicted nuclease with TOPRIM domain
MTESTTARDKLLAELERELESLRHDIEPYVNNTVVKPEEVQQAANELAAMGTTPEQTMNIVQDLLKEFQSENGQVENYSKQEQEEIQRLVKRAEELLEKFAQIGVSV